MGNSDINSLFDAMSSSKAQFEPNSSIKKSIAISALTPLSGSGESRQSIYCVQGTRKVFFNRANNDSLARAFSSGVIFSYSACLLSRPSRIDHAGFRRTNPLSGSICGGASPTILGGDFVSEAAFGSMGVTFLLIDL